MRLGVISDVHANHVALDAVLDAMGSVDRIVCAGDVVGYNPQPGACVERVRGSIVCVQGNHDRAIDTPERYRSNESAYAGLRYAAEQLTENQREWLRTLPTDRTLCDGRVRMVHSHPTHRGRYVRPEQFPELEPHLGTEDVLILGHTHIQHHEMVGDTLVVNPGSVGQPRDRDPRAAFAVVDITEMRNDSGNGQTKSGDIEERTVEQHRVSYDIERIQEKIENAGLPSWTSSRLKRGQ